MNKMGLRAEGKPTRLYLIRHGEVEASRQGKYNGHSDVGLSPEGLQPFYSFAERFSKAPIGAVYCSDLYRSKTGAEIIAKPLRLNVQVRPELREKNFGRWEGLTPEQVSQQFPEEWERWMDHPIDLVPSEGESYRDAFERVKRVLEEILKTYPQQEVVIVAHGGINRLILAHALDLDFNHIFRVEQKFSALNIIDFFEDVALIRLING